MAENAIFQAEEVLSEDQRRRAQMRLICTACANSVWSTTTVSVIGPLFLLTLGGGAFSLALLATVNYVSWLGQVLGLKLIPRYGKTGLAFHGGQLTLVPAVVLVAVSLLAKPGLLWLTFALVAYGLMICIKQTALTGWWPLLQDATAGDARGTFFTRLRMPMRLVEMLVPLAVGAYMGKTPSLQRFALPFMLGAVSLGLASLFIHRVPERHLAPPETGLLLRLRLAARAHGVRQYLAFMLQYSMTLGLVTPFWIFILKQERGLSADFLVWLVTAQAVGHLMGLPLWGKMVDKHGGRSALSLTLPVVALMGLAWLFAPRGGLPLAVWALAFYAIFGFLEGGYMMGRTWTMVSVVPEVYQSDAFTVVNLCTFPAAGIGSLLGGIIFEPLTRCTWSIGGFNLPVLYLTFVQVALLACWWTKHRLSLVIPQTSARQLVAGFWRRVVARPESE